jgi:hypothetical protein
LSKINPLSDPRWDKFIANHPSVSVFHTRGWLRSLQRTYGYQPVAYTTSAPADTELTNAILFCEIKSFLTGRRLVSLPFSDHCAPLVASEAEFDQVMQCVYAEQGRAGKIEVRPLEAFANPEKLGLSPTEAFQLHVIDIRPEADQLLRKMHKSCIQAKIKRAEKEALTYEQGRSDDLLKSFYKLFVMTRRKHGAPPQPFAWFQNLVNEMGESVTIHLASHQGTPIASILTLAHGNTVVYKYGCSDQAFSNLGGTPLLFWHSIREAKAMGAEAYDLGRTDLDNPGLLEFKERLGGKPTELHYYGFPAGPKAQASKLATTVRKLVSLMPEPIFTSLGRILYRHVG